MVNCLTGEKIARDYDEYYEGERHLEAQGIGALSGKNIRLAGLFGGGLPIHTEDNWQLELVTLNWPEEMILLVEPNSYLYDSANNQVDNFTLIERSPDIRAYGFSYTNKSFVIATTGDVAIYSRATNC